MLKRITCYFLACLFLASSTLLPLGDFSLLRDIPQMYHNYTKITTADEMGITDFIGDYLLHGKDIFGHNGNDKQQAGSNTVQFQHQANALNIVLAGHTLTPISTIETAKVRVLPTQRFRTSDYHAELFRPPLA